MKEPIQQKKVAYKMMGKNRSVENKAKYKNNKNRTKKVIANFMTKEAEKELTKLNKKPNNIFTLVKFIKKDGKVFIKNEKKDLSELCKISNAISGRDMVCKAE